MLKVLLTRRWLGALLVAAVFAVAAYFLGQWQWGRYEEADAKADRIEAHYDADPVPLTSVVGEDPVPQSEDWTRVRATGTYAADGPLLVRNRPWHGRYGYEIVHPFVLDSGATVLVDRGWVPNSPQGADVRPEFPPAPTGTVTITGWVQVSEDSLGREMPPGQLASIYLPEAEERLGTELLGAYVVLGSARTASGDQPERPQVLERPVTDIGVHQAYAFQWWASMPVGFVLVWFGVRRELREASTGGREPKPRKVRIWDEEDA